MKYSALFALLIFSLFAEAQQDPKYSQYMFNPMGVNAAYAGSREALSVVLTHRSQWVGIDGAPVTENFAIHSPLKNQNMALGLQILNDKIGPKNKFSVSGIYAYRIRLLSGKLAFALRGGIYNYKYNWDKITYQDPTDNVAQSGAVSVTVPTIDYAMYYNDKKNYIGLEFAHLNRPKLPLSDSINSNLNAHVSLLAGRAFVVDDDLIFRGSLLMRATDYAGLLDLNISVLLEQKLWLGVSLRSNYGIIGIVQFRFNNKFRAGLSYDYAMNQLQGQTGGSYELFLGYDFNIFKSKMISPRFF